jgi:hypothetical protein
VYAGTQGGPTLLDATYYSSADRSAVLDECGIRIQELRMLVRMSASAAKQHSSRRDRRRDSDGAAVVV